MNRLATRTVLLGGLAAMTMSPAAARATIACPGDCDASIRVTVDEIITCVSIALGDLLADACNACDANGDLAVTVDEIIAAVNSALDGCAAPPTPTPTATNTATATATPRNTPSELSAIIAPDGVHLSWPSPDAPNTDVLLLRRLNLEAEGPDDPEASIVYRGAEGAATDDLTALLPSVPDRPREYFYTLYGCSSDGTCDAVGETVSITPTLIEALRGGGYTIYWRHASANVCDDELSLGTADDPVVPDWWRSCDDNCDTAYARQLSEVGVGEAIDIGSQLRARSVPFGRVLTSEFCRCFRTAELMDLGPDIERVQAPTYFVYGEQNRCSGSYALLNQVPVPGTNTALIAHLVLVGECPVLMELQSAEAAIFKPDGDGRAEFVTRLLAYEWSALEPMM